ncbi:MAG: hypothetical protein KDE27_31870 [Planctomycetes bacterium]|nr:hypothetical protein [Planctomycetota bacterium]
MAGEPVDPERAPRPRRRWRRVKLAFLILVAAYGVSLLCGLHFAWPYDVPANLGSTPDRPELRAPDDGKRRVVVLLHGIMRSPLALGRLERTLRRHGYEVLNFGYPSTSETIEQLAARLAAACRELTAEHPVDEWAFVAHSMGGMVIQEFLRTTPSMQPWACVYIATPHRGAVLADLRKEWFVFRWFMGTKAALQLSPGAEIHTRPLMFAARSGAIVGDIGEGNPSIPGHDDGTVAVDEAKMPGAKAIVTLPCSHMRIAAEPRTVEQVLAFLRRGEFEAVDRVGSGK